MQDDHERPWFIAAAGWDDQAVAAFDTAMAQRPAFRSEVG
jgi:hypothetical protein